MPPPGDYISFTKWGNPAFDVQPVTPEESRFRHSGWAVRRSQVWCAFQRTGRPEGRKSRFANCGSGMWLMKAKAGDDLKLACNCCHDRFCVPCATARAARMRGVLQEQLKGKYVRFITLTLRHSRTPLSAQLDRLGRSFTALRRRAVWRDSVEGGAAFIELKLGERDGLWHVHLHCLCVGKFISQRDLSAAWHGVTGDSSIVDIRAVKDPEHVSGYVVKYVTKPADSSVFACETALDEMICALNGRRLCATFGKWRGLKLDDVPEDTAEWCNVASIESLRSRAAEGDPEAVRYLAAAARKWPLLARLFGADLPPPDPLP